MDRTVAFPMHPQTELFSPDMRQHPAHKKFIGLWSVNRIAVLVGKGSWGVSKHGVCLFLCMCASPGQNLVMAEAMFSKADRASEEGKAWMASRALLLW